ncbi:MAG: hypothetical protein Q8P67_03840, partial [archaeon]|nr:hypothetical protein [archaeon]
VLDVLAVTYSPARSSKDPNSLISRLRQRCFAHISDNFTSVAFQHSPLFTQILPAAESNPACDYLLFVQDRMRAAESQSSSRVPTSSSS